MAFAVDGDGVGFATESYASSALYTTLASFSGALWRIRRASDVERGVAERNQLASVGQRDWIEKSLIPGHEFTLGLGLVNPRFDDRDRGYHLNDCQHS